MASAIITAVYPDDHRQVLLRALRWSPDFEVEAILTYLRRDLSWHGHTLLHTRRGKCIGLAHTDPRCSLSWGRQRKSMVGGLANGTPL
jgi:hypothetical protein